MNEPRHHAERLHEEYDDGEVEWWGSCSCGWLGVKRDSFGAADDDIAAHLAAVEATDA